MSDVTEWNRGHPPRPGMVWMAGMWRQHQHALGPIEYVQSRVHEQHQPGMWNADSGRWEAAAVADNAGPKDAGPKADYHGPNDAAHRAVHEVAEHLLGGRVSDAKARRGLRDALDKADRPAEGRKVSDQAIGRALRFGGSPQIGLRLP
jgi:hypothetical protein